MNRIYRVVFNKTLNVMQVVSELQRRHGTSKSSVSNEGASRGAISTWGKELRLAPVVLALGLVMGLVMGSAPSAWADNPECKVTKENGVSLVVCTIDSKGAEVQYLTSGTEEEPYKIADGSKADGDYTKLYLQSGYFEIDGGLSSMNKGTINLGYPDGNNVAIIVLKGGDITNTATLNIFGGATVISEQGHKIVIKENSNQASDKQVSSVYISGPKSDHKVNLQAPLEFQDHTALTFGGSSFTSDVLGADTNLHVTGDDTTLTTQEADTFTGGTIVSRFGNLIVKNPKANLSQLPKDSMKVTGKSTTTYTGNGALKTGVTIDTGGKLITSGQFTSPTVSGGGTFQVSSGSAEVDTSLETPTTVDNNASLVFKGTTLEDLKNVDNSGTVTVASTASELGDTTQLLKSNHGTLNLGDGTDSVTYTATKLDEKVHINNKAIVSYTGDSQADLGAPTVVSGGTLKLSHPITNGVDLSGVKGGGTVEVASEQTSANLGTTVTVKVDPNQTLTYTGTAQPTAGKLQLPEGSTLKTTQNGLDLGNSLENQQGNLQVAATGTQTATALPTGTTTVNTGATLNFDGTEAPTGNITVQNKGTFNFDQTAPGDLSKVTAEEGSTIGLNHTGDPALDLSKMGGSGATIKVGAAQTVSKFSTKNTLDIPNDQTVTYTGTSVDSNDKLNLESGGTLKTAPSNGQTTNLGTLLNGKEGKLDASSGTTEVGALPNGGTTVNNGATLQYNGTDTPAGTLSVDNGGTFAANPGSGHNVDLTDKLGSSQGQLNVQSGTVSATALPNGTSTIAQDATLNYGGTSAPSNDVTVNGTLNFSGATPKDFNHVKLGSGGTVQLSHATTDSDPVDLSTLQGDAGTVKISSDQTASKLGSNTIDVDSGKTLTFNGQATDMESAKAIQNNGKVKLTGGENQDWTNAIGKIKGGTATPKSVIEVDTNGTTNALSPTNTIQVDAGKTLTYGGTTAPTEGQLSLQKDSTLKTTGHDLDLGDSLRGQKGNLDVAEGTQSASSLPNGKTSVDTGATLSLTGATAPSTPLDVTGTVSYDGSSPTTLDNVTLNNGGVLKLNHKGSTPLNLSGVKAGSTGNPGTIEVAQDQIASALPSTANVKVDPKTTLTYSGTQKDNLDKVTLENGSSLVLSNNVGDTSNPVDLSQVKGTEGSIVVNGDDQHVQTLPSNGNKVVVNSDKTLAYDGSSADGLNTVTLDPGANLTLNKPIDAGQNGLDLSTIGGKAPGGNIKLNANQTASKLSTANKVEVAPDQTLTYTGTNTDGMNNVNLDKGSKMVLNATVGTETNPVNLADIKGKGGTIELGANQTASSLSPGNTVGVPDGKTLTLTANSAPEKGALDLQKGGTLAIAPQSGEVALGDALDGQKGNLQVQKGVASATALPSGNNSVAKGATLDYQGTGDLTNSIGVTGTLKLSKDTPSDLSKVTLEDGGQLVLAHDSDKAVDLGTLMGAGKGTVDVDSNQTASNIGQNNVVVEPGKKLTFTGNPDQLASAKSLKNKGSVVLAGPDGQDWTNAIDKIQGIDSPDKAVVEVNTNGSTSALSDSNTLKVDAGKTLTYTGNKTPGADQLSLDKGSTLKTTGDGLNLADSLKGQKGSLEVAQGTQSANSLPEGTTSVDKGATLSLTGSPVPTSPIHVTGTVSYDNDSPTTLDNVTLNNGGLLKLNHKGTAPIDMGSVQGDKASPGTIEVAADQTASTLPVNANVKVDTGKTLTFSGDEADNLGSVDLQQDAHLALTNTLGTPEKPVDLNQIKGQDGQIDIQANQTANRLSDQNQINVEAGKTLTYTGTEAPVEGKLNLKKGGIFATNPGADNTLELGDSLKASLGTLNAQSGTQNINSLPATTDVNGGAVLNYNGAQSPEGNEININDGTVNMNKTTPSNDALKGITIGQKGTLSLNQDGSADLNFSHLKGPGGKVRLDSNQSANNLGSIPIDVTPGHTLTYTGDLSDFHPSNVTNNGRLMINGSGDLGDNLNGIQGGGTVGFGGGAHINTSSLGDGNIITVEQGASLTMSAAAADKPVNVQGLRLAGKTDLSNAGPVTITPKVDGKALTPYPWKGNSFAFKADRTAMITDGSDVTFNTDQTNKSVGDFVVQGGSVTYGSTLTEGSQDRKLFEGLVLADNGAKVQLSATGQNASSKADMAFIEANFNDHWTDHATVNINEGLGFGGVNTPAAPAPSLLSLRAATTSTNSQGQIELKLDNARWLNHGFSQLQSLVTQNKALVDYNNAEHDAKAVAIDNLKGNFDLYMPLSTADYSESGQIYVVKGDGNSTITLMVPAENDPDAANLNKNVSELIKKPLRVAVLGQGTQMQLDKTDHEVELDGELYTFQLIHKNFKGQADSATYDNGKGTLTADQADKLFSNAGDQAYYLRLIKNNILYAGITPAMLGLTTVSQEMAYRAVARMDSMADHYEPGMPARAIHVWAKGGALAGQLNNGQNTVGWTADFGVEGSKAVGNGVVRLGLQGRVEGSKAQTTDELPVSLKQTRMSAGAFLSYAHQGFYLGALGAYERVTQDSGMYAFKRTIQAAKASVETGVNLPVVDRFSIQPEVQVQYTHWFGNDFSAKYLSHGFKGSWKAGNSLQVRTALRFNKAQQIGDVDLNFHTTFGLIQEFKGQQGLTASRDLRKAIARDYEVKNYSMMQYEVGFDARLNDRFGLELNLEQRHQINSNAYEFRANAGLNVSF